MASNKLSQTGTNQTKTSALYFFPTHLKNMDQIVW